MTSTGMYASKTSRQILRKGMLIIFIPLATNLIWLGVLGDALKNSQNLIQEEQRVVRLQRSANHFMTSYGTLVGTMLSYLYCHRQGYKRQANSALADCIADSNVLIALTKDDAKFNKIFRTIQEGLGQEAALISTLPKGESVSSAFELVGKVKSMRQFVAKSEKRMACVADYVTSMEQNLASKKVTIKEARAKVSLTVCAGMIVNLLLSALVITLFAKNITGRLKILSENARMLPLHKPLLGKVEGHDELAALDQVLHRVNERLIEAQEYRSSLMQMMAHDLRSPMMACEISMQLLRRTDSEIIDQNSSNQIDSIEESLRKLIDLIDDLLILETLEHRSLILNKSAVQIDQLIVSAVNSIKSSATVRDITITLQAPAEILEIDELRINQVLVNLISNAIKFSRDGSTIEVLGARIDKQFRISIVDHGMGIDETSRSRIFEKFYQTTSGVEAGGSGIGLAIAQLIVEAHGGSITCDSEIGRGSVFSFTLSSDRTLVV
ncbi:MAG: HAMP domain-containing sensor histidine kinase [Candidatus Obscuribacterales bacterium]